MELFWKVHIPSDLIWIVVLGFIIAFILAFGIGANDVANSFGTSVGAKVLSLRTACILASIFETLGAVLLGAKVSDTIRKGIIDVEPYSNNTELLMMGNLAALSGSCVWMIVATLLRLPVSATHSIVGATVGFALVAHGAHGVNWSKLAMIIGSWFISPLLAGIVSIGIFFFTKFFILNQDDPLEPGLRFLPIFYAFTLLVNLLSIFYDGPPMLGFHKIPLWGTFVLSFMVSIFCGLVVRLFIVPWQRRRIQELVEREKLVSETHVETSGDHNKKSSDCGCLSCCQAQGSLLSTNNGSEEDVRNTVEIVPSATTTTTHQNHRKRTMSGCSVGSVGRLMPSVPPSVHVINDITHPNAKVLERHANKITKAEDAPLMNKDQYKNGQAAKQISVTESNVSEEGKEPNTTNIKVEEPEAKLTRSTIEDRPETGRLFHFLQVLTATFGAFAHGGNDVSNAIGPVVSIWLVATTQHVAAKVPTPIWILMYGGVGISLGLWVWGRRVIKTIGEDLTKITPSSGFAIELGSAVTVLVASNIGIPISTTHCKVGSVVFVGRFRARENVDWSIFRNIVCAWVVTLPITGGISAAIMAGLMHTL